LSEDPLRFAGGDSNFYRYVKNQSISYSDPYGLLQYYHTPRGTTVPPTGQNLANLQCFESCVGNDNLVITGGQEQTGHSVNSEHYTNNACDVANPGTGYNQSVRNEARNKRCARQCGFNGYLQEATHIHLQTEPGNGVPPT